jgi:hypothetical protein
MGSGPLCYWEADFNDAWYATYKKKNKNEPVFNIIEFFQTYKKLKSEIF